MKRIFILSVFCLFIILAGTNYLVAQNKADVFVLSTLHQYHETSKYYSFEELSRIVEEIDPDILAVELTADDLKSRKDQKVKQEYQRSIFPLIEKHKYQAVPLEPAEPLFSALLKLYKESSDENQAKSPQKVEAFSVYSNSLYDHLFKQWDSPRDVNSKMTDTLFELKHDFQNALFGEKEAKVWNDWNTHFLETITKAAEQNRGKKILVVVGVEHSYWLRGHLRKEAGVNYREIETVIK
ncbi:MAG: hypothetical protein KDB79_00985 [Acidobacteria bacterium]|nr:hypothetical protein [Acidobacteriota bacterium]